jgi:glycosyltransferase involved in cell wall biosynthesis
MLHFSALLESELVKRGHEARVIQPQARLGLLGRRWWGPGKWLGYADKFLFFPICLRAARAWADVVHICDHSNSLYTRHLDGVPNIVTCHDMMAVRLARGEFAGTRTRWTGKQYQRMVVNGLQRARYIACDSEATISDLRRITGVPAHRASVVHIGLNFPYIALHGEERRTRLGRLGIGQGERFLLHVGSSSWYKNQPGVIRIFQNLLSSSQARDMGLVLVTREWTPALGSLVERSGLRDRVRVFSDVRSEDLCSLYSAATALLFPSFYEGFGWPIIEAQACGCPVFTSNRAPMTEIGGNGAVYIDPENPIDAANIILEHFPFASRMREAGFENVKRFSTEKMMAKYIHLYQEVVNQRSSQSESDDAPQ